MVWSREKGGEGWSAEVGGENRMARKGKVAWKTKET